MLRIIRRSPVAPVFRVIHEVGGEEVVAVTNPICVERGDRLRRKGGAGRDRGRGRTTRPGGRTAKRRRRWREVAVTATDMGTDIDDSGCVCKVQGAVCVQGAVW